jgi:type VI secretion system protein ImpA
MALPQVIDIDALLQAISEEAPAGTDPRADSSPASLYYRTKDARNAARSAERAAVETGGASPEEWDTVADTAMTILTSHGKDLEIAAWLVEALLRTEGFAGLRDGMKVLAGIVNGFWETCFPELDEDGVEGKVSAVAGLNGSGAVGTLIQPIRLVPITHGSQWSFSLWNYEQATDLVKVTDSSRRQERIDNGAVTMEQFLESVADTSPAFFADTQAVIVEALAALAEMSAAFDAVAGVDAPPISALRDDAGQQGEAGQMAAGTVVVRKIEGYQSREEALAELTRISAYFRKTEPHSPMSYTLEDAVRRARMSLPDLLVELVEDPAHLQRILLAAGIKPPSAEQGY